MEATVAGMFITGLALMLVGPMSNFSPYESIPEGGKRIRPRLQRWGVGIWVAALIFWITTNL